MSVAAIVVCRDDGRALGAVLDALDPRAEIVVVDDGSTDLYTREALATHARAGGRLLRSHGRGVGAAVNAAVARTSSPLVVALNAGDRLPRGWLDAARTSLEGDPGLDLVACGPLPDLGVATLLARGVEVRAVIFRRAAWVSLDGVSEDATLGGAALADFVLRALHAGRRATLLSSGGGDGPAPATLVDAHRRLRGRHRAQVGALGIDLVLAKAAWLDDLRARRRDLASRQRALARELAHAQAAVRDRVSALAAAGQARVDWGDLRRLTPVSPAWGLERGTPLDRYYVERFLARHRADVRGRVLEVKDAGYTNRFGAGVTERAVVDIDAGNADATIVADLMHADGIDSERFDCVILTQTLHVLADPAAALRHAHRVLAPGGVLLCTLPAVARTNIESGGLDGGDHWRFTEASVRRMVAEVFEPEAFTVEVTGNVLVATAFLHGLAVEELTPAELDHVDPWHPVLFCVRAVKAPRRAASRARSSADGLIVLYHRVARVESDAAGLAIAPDTFRAHMEHLRRHWSPMPLGELAAAAAAGDVPERAVAVTLDDGYLDALTTVSPILTDVGVPATFFVTSDALDGEGELWWDTLESILLGAHAVPATLDIALDGPPERLATRTGDDRAVTWRRIHDWMVAAGADDRDARLRAIVGWSRQPPPVRASHRPLRRAELRQLAARGHAIGGHGARHVLLRSQPLDAAIREVLHGKVTLEAALGRKVTAFAYPYGACDERSVQVVGGVGFTVAVTGDARAVRGGDDPLRLPRLDVSRLDAAAFVPWLEAAAAHREDRS